MMKVKLNLGCAGTFLEGYINIDLDSLDLANVDICSLDNISLSSGGEALTQAKDVVLATAGEAKDTLTSLDNFTISVG